jgi:DNA polymerase-3 subunit epsilon
MGIKSKLVVFDLETGGLVPAKNPIMEIGVVTLDQKTLQEELQYETLIKPYYGLNNQELAYDPRAIEVHGIEPSRTIREGKDAAVVVESLIKLFKQLKVPRDTRGIHKPILCGHNVVFDVAFLRYLFSLVREDLSNYVLSNNGEIIVWDTMQMATILWSNDESAKFNLGACCERAGLGNFLAHSALADTKTTAELLKYFLESFRGNGKTVVREQGAAESNVKRRSKITTNHKVKFEF